MLAFSRPGQKASRVMDVTFGDFFNDARCYPSLSASYRLLASTRSSELLVRDSRVLGLPTT